MNLGYLTATMFALSAANFLYQAFTGQNWFLAFDRSAYQILALLFVYFQMKYPKLNPYTRGDSAIAALSKEKP